MNETVPSACSKQASCHVEPQCGGWLGQVGKHVQAVTASGVPKAHLFVGRGPVLGCGSVPSDRLLDAGMGSHERGYDVSVGP